MKKLFIVCASMFLIGLLSNLSVAVEYCKDFLEPENPGGGNSLKTWDEEWTLDAGEEVVMDIWVNDLPAGLITCGFWISYDPSRLDLLSVEVYHSPVTTWDPGFTGLVDQPAGPGTFMVTVGEFAVAPIDEDGDILVGKITVSCLDGNVGCDLTIQTIPGFDTIVGGVDGVTLFDPQVTPNTVTIHQYPPDGDDIPAIDDNCPSHYNPNQEDTDQDGDGNACDPDDDNDNICDPGESDASCTGEDNCPLDYNTNQEDTYPPGGNGIGDACDCESDLDCDGDVDGTDKANFKLYFGRSLFENPCNNEPQCSGDFDCDNDCDGTDVSKFKEDFGRSGYGNPCPPCTTGDWCIYP
jgi:hypothetical protein